MSATLIICNKVFDFKKIQSTAMATFTRCEILCGSFVAFHVKSWRKAQHNVNLDVWSEGMGGGGWLASGAVYDSHLFSNPLIGSAYREQYTLKSQADPWTHLCEFVFIGQD